MASQRGLFGSSLARKYWMALTGLFLITFLVVHLLGNLAIVFGTGEDFNAYAAFMTSFPPIKIVSYLLYASIVLHAADGIALARQNRAARPVAYGTYNGAANAGWASRNMALLGIFTLLFILVHMKSFWFEMHFGTLGLDANGNKDLFTITTAAFEQVWYTAFYVIAMVALGFHLWHGFQSAFQTMGWTHPTYTPIVQFVGRAFAVVVCGAFALIPLYVLISPNV
ncbi:MAG: succinate dehydrogenase cytochrome b subunit [Bacteroidota bacterium]|jgi:succinate dehydrogenase / fumarate reductase cytochrome b subunit